LLGIASSKDQRMKIAITGGVEKCADLQAYLR